MKVCTVENCDRQHYALGLCHPHWQRQRKGMPLGPLRPRSRKGEFQLCSVEGCGRRMKGHRLCRLHLERLKATGSTDDPVTLPATCSVEGCGRPRKSRDGLCALHYVRQRKHGSVDAVKKKGRSGPRKAEVGYKTMHQRVKAARGPAREHACSECGGQAIEWAYDHADPDQIEELVTWGHGKQHLAHFSLDPEHYRPMCRSCHRAFDAAH